MSDRPAERRRARRLRVDVDELPVLGHLGEGVDARLIDEEPARDERLAADARGQFVDGHLLFGDAVHHPCSPNIGGGAEALRPPSTGTIAPLV